MACVDSLPLFPCSCLLSWNKSFRKVFRRLLAAVPAARSRTCARFLHNSSVSLLWGDASRVAALASPWKFRSEDLGTQAALRALGSPWPAPLRPNEVACFPVATVNVVQELCLCFSKQLGLLNCLPERHRLGCTRAWLFLQAEHNRPSCQPSLWAS